MRVAEGGNFTIELDEGVATLRVWKRPDLSFDEGAQLAVMILDNMRRLAAESAEARGFVMDLRDAPILTGKRTRATLGEIIAGCEAAKKPIGVLLAAGVQHATLEEALSAPGPTQARVFTDADAASVWARGGARERA